jgi:hypothetical protein
MIKNRRRRTKIRMKNKQDMKEKNRTIWLKEEREAKKNMRRINRRKIGARRRKGENINEVLEGNMAMLSLSIFSSY